MRVLWVTLLPLCAACASLGAAPSIPREVVMEGTRGSFALRVGSNVAWRLDSLDSWLSVSPSQGVGPRTVELRAHFEGETDDQAEYLGGLLLSGDVHGSIAVRLSLVRVVGRVEEAGVPQAQGTGGLSSREVRSQATATGRPEVLVKYRADLRQVVLPQGSRLLSHDRISRIARLQADRPEALLERLRLDPRVEWAEINGSVQVLGEPTDQYYPEQWHLRSTGARFTYLQTYSRPVTVAVVDTGVRYDHPDLSGRLWGPGEGAYDFVGDSADPNNPCGSPLPGGVGDPDPTDPCDQGFPSGGSHGTHVTGIIVANSGNFLPPCPTCSASGVVGMAYNAPVKVLPLRVLDTLGNGTFESVALAVRYAAGIPVERGGQVLVNPQPAQVINLSLGSTVYSNAMCEAVADAVARGVLVVAAAGNYQQQRPGALVYPAACPGAIAVAATDRNHRVAPYSQQNSSVSIAAPGGAPGGGILSTTWDYTTGLPNYSFYMGTSQAAPQVAAALAMLLSSAKVQTGLEAWERLWTTATDLGPEGRDDAYGYGLLNLPGAFAWTLPKGGFALSFDGPGPRRVSAPNGFFELYLVPGQYRLKACRDDSGNGLCDPGEPVLERQLQVNGRGTFDLGTLRVGP
ncbi:MAG: S8 family serine peptidase [Meiothermus sp.]|uniref:S8 family serine peptidase n=1 Tax=Meiothermus sp. TaxID=1955249 RepID=UPI0025E791F5|nr:S8 family serine peptidase [Meiothermus sp.]MCS7194147.1 S8 family serine peptidase [Meiothermus sp.]MCX7739858.1 S8 family serine peptidase [Meiothermus sp.]MDW8091801.1 S8 family serine peptidase [Meiothermus sp.]MDW8481542.1 S8 family serine peptidase [Meiothermus sp.]